MEEKFVAEIDENKGIIFKVCNMYCRTREDQEDLFQDIAGMFTIEKMMIICGRILRGLKDGRNQY